MAYIPIDSARPVFIILTIGDKYHSEAVFIPRRQISAKHTGIFSAALNTYCLFLSSRH